MAEVLTTTLKNDIARLFYEDLTNNDYYVMVSSVSNQELVRVDAVNSQYSKNEFKEKVLFGKKLYQNDLKFMIKYYPWQKDETYTQYDDQVDLEGTNFYAVVGPTNNDSGDYRVYKCLSNNNGNPSTVPPNYNPTTINQIYRTADGYVWKFMYYLTESDFEAYNAIGFIPLHGTFEINPNPSANANNIITGAEVSDIFVENYIDNNGYTFVSVGNVPSTPGNQSQVQLSSSELSQITDYYSGMTLVLTKNTQTWTYLIDSYTYRDSSGTGFATVVGDPQGDGVTLGASFKIVPTIEIKGDGTGAVAIPYVNSEGRITSVQVLETGSGYHRITATVKDPAFDFDPDDPTTIDVRATLRPVLSPEGYHNWNLIDEMHCRHILLYGYITEDDNNQIGATNNYSAIGIIKNPEFTSDASGNTASPHVFDNRIQVITDDYGKAVVDGRLYQVDTDQNIIFDSRVHDIYGQANTVYLCDYMGPYINQTNNDISFDYTKDLFNSTGQRIQINNPVANNVIESRYVQRSGTVYFMEDFFPLERSETSREEYKLVLEF